MARNLCKVTKKIRYYDSIAAKLALARYQNKDRDQIPSRVYKCEFCKGWHLTSQERKTQVVDSK